MTATIRYYALSSGLHGIAVLAVMLMATTALKHKELVTIDFNLTSQVQQCIPAKNIHENIKPTASPVQTKALPTLENRTLENRTVPAPSMERAEPIISPANISNQVISDSKSTVIGSAENRSPSKSTVQEGTVNSGPTAIDKEIALEQGRKKYLKEHFAYIRELIVKKLNYPAVARKMEWSGKVVLAFIVTEDGGVSSIRLKESSGYPVLDNSAMDTVRNVAPFPRPPASAEIVMPIMFRLQ